MDSIARPLTRLVQAVQWFVIAREVRLLHVVTESSLRLAALEHIAAGEHHGDNNAPFFVLETPTEEGEDGWEGRGEELRADYEELRTLLDKAGEGVTMPAIWAAPRAGSSLERFCMEVSEALAHLTSPFEGLVLVLAPVWVRQPQRWVAGMRELLGRPELSRVRFVILEADGAHCEALARELADRAERVEFSADERAVQQDMAELIEAMSTAPVGTTGARLTGAAGPSAAPPPRPRSPRPLSAQQREVLAQQVGVAPALLDPGFQQTLRLKVLSAAQALREGRASQAVEEQRQARDLCREASLVREAVVMDLVLGGYVLQTMQPEQALQIFHEACQRAESNQLYELAVQARLAKASTLLVLGHQEEAALVYCEAGQLAARLTSPVLAIEGYRMCGQLWAAAGKLPEATTAWRRALELASKASPEEQRASSAPEAARQLAALCRHHGLQLQAEALEAQAASLEG